MPSAAARPHRTAAWRQARLAWRLLYSDSQRCLAEADAALARARQRADRAAEGWARLTRGFHLIWYATPAEAMRELRAAQGAFESVADRAGGLLAEVGLARAIWRNGEYRASLRRVLPLRDEGLRVLRADEVGMLLNTIAGCYSELGESQQAFAYMFQALQASGKARSDGFDVVLYCNLAHELIQLGDYHQALSYLHEGLQRCEQLSNPRLFSVLSINRVICLTNLQRPAEAMPDVERLLRLPADEHGRGRANAHYETLALAVLRAGDLARGERLIELAREALGRHTVPDERLMLQVASAEALLARGRPAGALAELQPALARLRAGRVEGVSLRVHCLYFETMADVHERLGQNAQALAMLRLWQERHVERALQASEARFQAAALQTEVLRLQVRLDATEASRRETERARAELEAANRALERKVREVQALQEALRQQATRDFLTGLFNRRHLDDVLPGLLALAQRDGQPLSLVIIDLDHFKDVNDALGHAAGDRLLAEFGRLLDGHCRKSDIACRYGGEEFCLLLPRTGAAAAQRKCQALLKDWSQAAGATATARPRTFSAGVAESRAPATVTAQALLRAADDALLRAKRSGRNRVLVHEGAVQVVA
jgi:diguanylate cyclase (GGDEF)-like protein